MDEISQSVMRCVSSWTWALFSFIVVTQYDIRALRARQGKEYKVNDGIINSAATNRAMRDRATGMDCELTNLSPAAAESVKY